MTRQSPASSPLGACMSLLSPLADHLHLVTFESRSYPTQTPGMSWHVAAPVGALATEFVGVGSFHVAQSPANASAENAWDLFDRAPGERPRVNGWRRGRVQRRFVA